jgi:anthranilate phosphoribosyltransferase
MSAPAPSVQSVSIVEHIRTAMAGKHLTADETARAVGAIMDGAVTPAQVAALLVALALKGETADEIAGAASAMRAHALRVKTTRTPLMDVCGTGGDASGSFNVSTAVAFVVAGAGVAVAKHGNRAMSSRCGSADVLAALGVRIDSPPELSARSLERDGIAFLFAQAHHPAMRHVAPVRREIGVRTLFNVLGPLTNPAGATHQVVGVAHPSALHLVAGALGRLGSARAAAVHGSDGLDEATLSGPTRVVEWTGSDLREYEISPADAGLESAAPGAIAGGDAAENAMLVRSVLEGRKGPHRDVVLLNAALALVIAGMASDLRQGRGLAEMSIDRGAALGKLQALVQAGSG